MGWTNEKLVVQFPAGAREFHFLQNVQTDPGTHQSSIQWIMGAVYSGIKRPKSEADHLPLFLTCTGIILPILLLVLLGVKFYVYVPV